MGRTYQTIGRANKTFDVNFSGADILGEVMRCIGEHSREIEKSRPLSPPCTRFAMNAEDCKRSVEKLQALTDKQYKTILEKCEGLIEPYNIKELKDFTETWIAFLKDCKKGYEVPE